MNLTVAEVKALNRLKKDDTIVVTPADKGKALVIMDKEEYINRMEVKFSDQTTYQMIEKDPTQEIKENTIEQLNSLKKKGHIEEKLYDKLYPHVAQIPRAYGSLRIHKDGYPLREIVDSMNSVCESIDKYV